LPSPGPALGFSSHAIMGRETGMSSHIGVDIMFSKLEMKNKESLIQLMLCVPLLELAHHSNTGLNAGITNKMFSAVTFADLHFLKLEKYKSLPFFLITLLLILNVKNLIT
jgi:hypothetical protein